MNLRPERKNEPDINLTPLIDVVFLLLIFFMVSTTFKKETQLSISLPRSAEQPAEQTEKAIEVTIDAQGQYYVNQRMLVNTQLATLKQALKEAAASMQDPRIVLSADAKTPHQAVITAMDAARQQGISRLSFAAVHVEDRR